MNESSHVPELRDDEAARCVHRRDDRAPTLDLLRVPDAGRVRPAQSLRADSRCFRNDQTCTGTLSIIRDHHWCRHMIHGGACARQRRHEDAIARRDGSRLDRVKKRGHATVLSFCLLLALITPKAAPAHFPSRSTALADGGFNATYRCDIAA